MSTGVAWALVLALACAGVAIVTTNFGPLISSLYAFGLFLGTVYSVPPFRCGHWGRWTWAGADTHDL